MIRCAFRHFVKAYQKQSLYLPSDIEGCAEGFVFCLKPAAHLVISAPRGVHLLNFAHAHNEKSCPVTINKTIRYEGVQIVHCINCRRIHLTFLPFRVMYRHYNRKEELQLFETEVEYRLAKWILAGMLQDGVISDSEMQKAWKKIAEHYEPPFLEVDVVGGTIGDRVTVDGK